MGQMSTRGRRCVLSSSMWKAPEWTGGQVEASSREIGFISRMAARCEVGGKSDGLVVLDLGGGTLKFHLDARVVFHLGFLVGLVNRVLGLAPGILDLPLHLLNHAFDLQLSIVCQFACLALGSSNYFVESTLRSILVHRSASVG